MMIRDKIETERYTLYLGDCMDVLPMLAGVDAVVTDPPYEITATGGGIGAKRKYLADIVDFTDGGFDPAILSRFDNWLTFGTLRQVPSLIAAAADRRWMLLTWNKPNPTPLCGGNYLPDTEYAIHAWRGKSLFGECRDKHRFFVYPCEQDKRHPNEKPESLMRKCVTNASGIGSVILDPFMGSGTTGVACMKLGRKFIGVEIDEGYFKIAAKRIAEAAEEPPLFKAIKDVQPDLFGKTATA